MSSGDRRMDVAFPADGCGISKMIGDGLYRFEDVLPALIGRRARTHFAQRLRRKDGSVPCAKVFGSKILTADLSYIVHTIFAMRRFSREIS